MAGVKFDSVGFTVGKEGFDAEFYSKKNKALRMLDYISTPEKLEDYVTGLWQSEIGRHNMCISQYNGGLIVNGEIDQMKESLAIQQKEALKSTKAEWIESKKKEILSNKEQYELDSM